MSSRSSRAARQSRRFRTFTWMVMAAGCALGACVSAAGTQPSPSGRPLSLRVGMTEYAFSGLNANDAEAAFKVLARNVGKHRGYAVSTQIRSFPDAHGLKAAIQSRQVNFAIMNAWDYVDMNLQEIMPAVCVPSVRGTVGDHYLVLTRRGGPFKTLEDLRGRELLQLKEVNAAMGRFWLRVWLLERQLGSPETFFGRVTEVNKATAAVLPVFFDRQPACLVSENAFEVMRELNPQVGEQLAPRLRSDRLLDGLVCLATEGWPSPQQRQDVLDTLLNLSQDPAGRQLLTLFRIDVLVPFQEHHLESVRQLHAVFERVAAEAVPSPLGNPPLSAQQPTPR